MQKNEACGNIRVDLICIVNEEKKMSLKILFQGDSITDCGRNRAEKAPNKGLGSGYVSMVASRLLCDDPDMKIYNRGVAGNRILDMYARWEEDAMTLDVDVISIHNCINDIG